MKTALKRGDLKGRWRVLSWVQRYDDGREVYPVGQSPCGFLQYDDDGRLAAMISRADRAPFTTGGQWNASAEEKARAYDTFLCYSGTYELDGDLLTHHVDLSLFPNWIGATQKRRGNIADGRLNISARLEDGTPEARTMTITAERWSESPTP